MDKKSKIEKEQEENAKKCINLGNVMKKCFKSSKISTKPQITVFVGNGTVEIDDNKPVEFSIELGAVTNSPIITYKNKHFILTWEDICALAIASGLFESEEDTSENKEKPTQIDAEGCPVNEVGEENLDMGGDE